jgi:UDP-glucose 4-epimerase
MTVLVTGGAGYIGSHIVWVLDDAKIPYVVLDNFSAGTKPHLPAHAVLVKGNAGDAKVLEDVFKNHAIDTVIHAAGSTDVAKSMVDPLLYYHNNTENTRTLLAACISHKVKNFIFSSTAAVYGSNPLQLMKEEYAPAPESPYARSKLMAEDIIKDVCAISSLNYCILRYFNVAGADPKLRTGPSQKNATHLIKVVCEVAMGKRDSLSIFGTDYPTQDGTCLRDFLHVSDLANAHLDIIRAMNDGRVKNVLFNVGYGHGYSVLEIVKETQKIIGKALPVVNSDRRAGDIVALTADSTALKGATGWAPRYNDLSVILSTAIDWEKQSG